MAAGGKIRATTEGEFLALLVTMMRRAVIDKARIARRFRLAPIDDPEWDISAPDDAPQLEQSVREAMENLPPDDRVVLSLWLQDLRLDQIADAIGVTRGSITHRWRRIRVELRSRLASTPGLGERSEASRRWSDRPQQVRRDR